MHNLAQIISQSGPESGEKLNISIWYSAHSLNLVPLSIPTYQCRYWESGPQHAERAGCQPVNRHYRRRLEEIGWWPSECIRPLPANPSSAAN